MRSLGYEIIAENLVCCADGAPVGDAEYDTWLEAICEGYQAELKAALSEEWPDAEIDIRITYGVGGSIGLPISADGFDDNIGAERRADEIATLVFEGGNFWPEV